MQLATIPRTSSNTPARKPMISERSQVDQNFEARAGRAAHNVSVGWLKWVAMIITASFTSQAAWFLTHSYFYAVAAVILAEGSFLFWEGRFRYAENAVQQIVAGSSWVISIAAIALTGLASATFLANQAGLFSLFAVLPDWVQSSITYTMISLAAIHAVTGVVYAFVSDSDAARRQFARETRTIQELKDRAKLKAGLTIARREAAKYLELVETRGAQIGDQMGLEEWERTVAHVKGQLGDTPSPTQQPRSMPPALFRAPEDPQPAIEFGQWMAGTNHNGHKPNDPVG